MSGYSFQQLEQAWVRAGGRPGEAQLAAAVAEAESGGNPRPGELNDTPPDYSVGPWQINYYGSNYTGRAARYGSPQSLEQNLDADARAAVDLADHSQSGWDNWTTYTHNLYEQYLPGGSAYTGANNVGSGVVGSGASGGGVSTGMNPPMQDASLASSVLGGDITGSIREFFIRMTELVGGAFLIYLGMRSATSSFNARNQRSQAPRTQRTVRSTATATGDTVTEEMNETEETEVAA